MHCPSFSLSLHAPLVTRAFHVAAVLLRNTSAVRRHRCPSSDVISRRRFSSSIQFIVPVGIRCPLLFKACGLAPPVHFFFGGGAWPLTLSCCSNYDPGWRLPASFFVALHGTPPALITTASIHRRVWVIRARPECRRIKKTYAGPDTLLV